MNLSGHNYYIEHIECILIFSLIGFIVNGLANKIRFYKFPDTSFFIPIKISLIHVILCFAIYLVNSLFLPPLLLPKLRPLFHSLSYQTLVFWTQVLVMLFSLITILGFCLITLRNNFKRIWKDLKKNSSLIQDCSFGILTLFIAFPLVAIVEQCADILVYMLFGVESYEQVAVIYLKMALKAPSQLVAALILILFAAPVMEELLFRGLLQTWIKKHLGIKAAILITSLCFALFHMSETHGVGNFSLIPSLFVFSCFLGFIYERQRSLFASIVLHMTFNLSSTLRILFTIDS